MVSIWLPAVITAVPVTAQTVIAHSERTVMVDRKPATITTEIGTVPVASAPGRNDATAGYISHVRAGGAAERPVLVAFNGGPGASSTYLQLGGLGLDHVAVPQRPEAPLPSAPARAVNDDNLLDTADLLFLDPPGTGFSEVPAGADSGFYHSVHGDALVAAQVVRAWLVAHGRTHAPIYVLGESYGTIRAAAMIDALHDVDPTLQASGVLLLGQALNMIETAQRPDNIVSYVVSLPTLAAIACYHRKLVQPCDPARAADAAQAFAGTIYLHALYQGRGIASSDKQRVAGQLAALSGIPAAYYLAHDLRISKEQFRVELLRGEGKVVGRYDARYTAPRAPGAGPVVGADAFSAVSAQYEKAMPGYLRSLGVADPAGYKVLAPPKGSWNYGGEASPFTDWPFLAPIEQAATRDPHFRLFVSSGLYDLTTTIGAADYLIAQSSLAPAQVRIERFPAGHVSYSDEASRHRLIADIRAFIAAGSPR
jgi:carboxypeptidase C (cathepsin A)